MRYDLDLVYLAAMEAGLPASLSADQRVEIDFGDGAILCFQNAEREEDCFIGFLGTLWHAHDEIIFADPRGNFVELDYLALISALAGGEVLLCALQANGQIVDRWLIHGQYNNEFQHLQMGEQVLVRRAMIRPAK
jgi:hypothetical protein